jgi:hypothetical protein
LLRQRDYLIALAVFVLTLALAGLIHPILAPSSLLENILVLMRTSAQWRLAAGPQTTPLIEFAVQLNMLAVLGSWFSHWRAHSLKKSLARTDCLVLACGTLYKNRDKPGGSGTYSLRIMDSDAAGDTNPLHPIQGAMAVWGSSSLVAVAKFPDRT